MKKLILIGCLVATMTANALTRKEMIQEKLKKIGVSQNLIDETVNLDKKYRDNYILETDENILKPQIEDWENLLKKDTKNYYARDILSSMYLYSGRQDLNKSKKYLEENKKYYDKFEGLYSDLMFYTVSGDEEKAKKVYEIIKKEYKNRPEVIDLIDISLNSVGVVNLVNSLNEEPNYENFYYDELEQNKTIRDFPEELSKEFEKNKKNIEIKNEREDFLFSKNNINKIFENMNGQTTKIAKKLEKKEKLIKFFEDEKNKIEFNVTDEILRGFKLEIGITRMSRLLLNSGGESAVKYYFEYLDDKNLTKEEVEMNKTEEIGTLNLVIMYLSTVENDKFRNEYKEKLINSNIVKLLEKVYESEKNK